MVLLDATAESGAGVAVQSWIEIDLGEEALDDRGGAAVLAHTVAEAVQSRFLAGGVRKLEDRLQLGKSTITELVLRSEKRGLVRRDLDRDRPGAITVRLTRAGERRLEAVVAALGDERRRLVEILSQLR